jgi:hypothetical protein
MEGVEKEFRLDPRISSYEPKYTITKGPSKVIYQNYLSQNYSTSILQFNIVPPNATTYLDRKLLVECSVDFTLTAADPTDVIFAGPVEDSGVIGLRYMPLNNVSSNFLVNINGNAITYTPNEIFAPMSQYNTPAVELEQQYWSYAPSCKNVGSTFDSTFGTPRSQFASRFQNTLQDSNAVTSNMELISNVAGQAVVRCTWTEPILYPPFIHSQMEREGLIGLNSALILQWTLSGLERFLGYDNVSGVELSGISGNWAAPPQIRAIWLTAPMAASLGSGLEMAYKYPYSQIVPFNSTPVTLTAGETVNISSNNIQFTGIPECCYIYVREPLSDRTPFDSDSFARISKVNIIFNNISGILANATPVQIHSICSRNGLKQRYADWYGLDGDGVGSVVKLRFDADIPLSEANLAVGSNGTFQFTVNVDATNLQPVTTNYLLYVVVCYEGVLTVVEGQCRTNINMVSASDVLHGASDSTISNADYQEQASYGLVNGGSIISTASNFINRGQKFYSAHKNTIDNVLSVGKQLGLKAIELLPVLLGAGMDYHEARDALEGAGFSGGGLSGGSLAGGRLITNHMDLITSAKSRPKPKRRY